MALSILAFMFFYNYCYRGMWWADIKIERANLSNWFSYSLISLFFMVGYGRSMDFLNRIIKSNYFIINFALISPPTKFNKCIFINSSTLFYFVTFPPFKTLKLIYLFEEIFFVFWRITIFELNWTKSDNLTDKIEEGNWSFKCFW